MARAMRLGPSAAYPVRSASWPSTMLTPTALMKPTMTALETKRMIEAEAQQAHHEHDHAGDHREREEGHGGIKAVWTSGISAMTTPIAPVPWTAMNAELVTKAPAAGPTR